MTKVHLGCWHRFIPGFVHVDLCDFEHIDYKSTVDALPFFPDGSVDLLYASHVFEYFDAVQAPLVLKEWKRVLKKGGVIRLAVPNFPALAKVYEMTGDISRVRGPLYGRMNIATQNGDYVLYHKTVYDEISLSKLLSDHGFVDVRFWNWRETEHADVDDHSQAYFPHMKKDDGLLISLNIEATKD